MNLYIKQYVFTWGDRFTVYDGNGYERYYVEGEVFTWGKKLRLYAPNGDELAFIRQQLLTFRPKYDIFCDNSHIAEVIKEFTLFCHEFSVLGPGWNVSGDFLAHDYKISSNNRTVAVISKKWFTFGDAYEINIDSSIDEITALSVVLVVDACVSSGRNQ